MSDMKKQLLDWIEEDREKLIGFFSEFVATPTPNPPGDTRDAVAHIRRFLDSHDLAHRVIDPEPLFPNVAGTFDGKSEGKHLVLNGHIDVFPADDEGWSHGPWSGEVAEGSVWGRGSSDMKCGTSTSIFTFMYLNRIRDRLNGKLTLTCVSDEETFGPWGARYLMENHPEVHGDCCLNGEPSSPYSIRFGEKGPMWLTFHVRTKGAHGAYTHAGESASLTAMQFCTELVATIEEIEVEPPHNIGKALEEARDTFDRAMGEGAHKIIQKVTCNIGVIDTGIKVNVVPGNARIEADIRMPVGCEKETVTRVLDGLLARYPQIEMEEQNYMGPSWCDPHGKMVGILQDNVENLKGFRPVPIVSLGGTDARLWRYEGINAYVYGPSPEGMGQRDEHVPVDDFLHVIRSHVLSAYDYLKAE
ncbi:MAG: M20/M25/M40 family metallo-hydrolase [Rhodospirillaceae bacterium]|jgi:succinyl-diaminopimelate desuccinylase|nr:M20/M25/M40 family metallo-hydrolase [Rhodospirillaceae bacterium]MBT6510239.1 M20/M25/M40 family metallo-hydrolase [Rhodospirillaceae bacterium]MBT7613763.1 M20/M25/M40 family metallo-hydrolase [Rhodospirillaceae bacterium]MBT7648585.1 M20/M25/M40 family metallo-hydrolase [Rhodospirillaceae bacterium]